MVNPYPLNPFLQLPNCDNGSYNPATYQNIPCDEMYRKIIALRVYFSLIIINFLFIISTTAYFIYRLLQSKSTLFPPSDIITTDEEAISKQWRVYSLRKRGLFGSVLGALGHLIFSSTVLLYQVFVTSYTCDIYLWGPIVGFYIWTYSILWRTLRLHMLIRYNALQQRYLNQQTNPVSYIDVSGEKITIPATSTYPLAETSTIVVNSPKHHRHYYSHQKKVTKVDADYVWFMRHKQALNVSTPRHIMYVAATLVFVALVIVCIEALVMWDDGTSSCEFRMGNYMVLSMVVFFFLVIGPFVVWYLRNDGDAHGIRRELWVTMIVAIPCFILCITWQLVFEYPSNTNIADARGVFSPSNWLLFVTTTNHVMTIILPVFKTLSLNNRNNSGLLRSRSYRWLKKWMPSKQHKICKMFKIKMTARHRSNSTTTLQRSIMSSGHQWELTMESLYQALNEPVTLDVLKTWAIKDFSVENVLFYDRYLFLAHQVSLQVPHYSDNLQINRNSVLSQFPTLSKPTQDLLHIPICAGLIPDMVDFYTHFIADQSSLQVNISHRARGKIDVVLGPLSNRYRRASDGIVPNSMQITSEVITPPATSANKKILDMPSAKVESSISDEPLTLELFEHARKEVFWNIFSGVYPKIVEAYNQLPT